MATRDTMLELATCALERLRSFFIVTVSRGGKVYLEKKVSVACFSRRRDLFHWTYQAQNASINPIQEKKNTLPYMFIGLRTGMLRAFLLMGHTSGDAQRAETLNRCMMRTTNPPMQPINKTNMSPFANTPSKNNISLWRRSPIIHGQPRRLTRGVARCAH